MIEHDRADRVLRNLTERMGARTGTSVRSQLDAVADFASEWDLDLQDTTTLMRYLTGEMTEQVLRTTRPRR